MTLNGEKLTDRESAHDELTTVLGLPAWYGRNLDALMDCLTDLFDCPEITVRHASAVEKAEDPYGRRVLRVLKIAEARGVIRLVMTED